MPVWSTTCFTGQRFPLHKQSYVLRSFLSQNEYRLAFAPLGRKRCHREYIAGFGHKKIAEPKFRDICDPNGIRTRVAAVRGRSTRPLYDGAVR